VRGDELEALLADGFEQVALRNTYRERHAETARVLPGELRRIARDVARHDAPGGARLREGDRDAAGAGTQVERAAEHRTGLRALERHLDERLRVGSRHEP